MTQNVLPDPELMKKDPMAELFGPGSGVKLFGETDDDIPEEVRALLDEHGLGKKSFQCILKEIPAGSSMENASSSTNTTFIRGFTRGIPSADYIAKTYGPGNYLLCFTWQTRDPDGSRHNNRQEVPVIISEKVLGEYKRQRLSEKIKDASEIGSQVRDALVEKSIEGSMIKALTGSGDENKDPRISAKEYISEIVETSRMLGLSPLSAAQVPAKAIEWEKIIPAAAGILTAFMSMQQQNEQRRSDEFNKMLMLMMSTSQSANNQMLEIVKAQSGAGSGNLAIKEFKDMIFGALDIKQALSGNEKESLGDKIFKLIESVAPSILSIAATTAQAREAASNPMVKSYIDKNPDFQALRRDPVEMAKVVGKLDQFYGQKQTDLILQVAGWGRPIECPHDPDLMEPPEITE